MTDDKNTPKNPKPEGVTVERREAEPVADEALYRLSRREVKNFVEGERRQDQLDRVREVRMQRRVWVNTMAVCSATVLVLLGLAVWGLLG